MTPAPAFFRNVVDSTLAKAYRRQGWWGEDTVASITARHAADRPDGVAFVSDHGSLSWAEYHAAATRVAAALVLAGVAEGERVAVWLPDGATVHAAFVAGEMAGITTVGIGARAGDAELRYLLGKTGATTLVSMASHRGRSVTDLVDQLRRDGFGLRQHLVLSHIEQPGPTPIHVNGDRLDERELEYGRSRLYSERRPIGPDDLFLINSTSGTTGLPKCVMHTPNRWNYFHQVAVENGDLTADDIFFGAVPAPFGFGLWTSHVTPTMLGAQTVVHERFSAEETLRAIELHRVTVISCVSTQFLMMLNSPDIGRRDLSSLRVMFTGGEAVPFERARAFEEATGVTVLQFFGSNESGLFSGTTLDDTAKDRLRTAGRVRPEMQVRLFDNGRDVTAKGTGQPGGKGPATCLGYLDDADANRELFTRDGWLLMGDIVTLDDRGYLTVTGRTSDIIIRGGKNISAVQVEDEVSSHPAVALSAAVAMPDDIFGERVCVFVELRDGFALDLSTLLDHLSSRGASKEMFPERLIIVDRLPRSSGGKVEKGQLRQDARQLASMPTPVGDVS